MSLEGKATADTVLRGKINSLDVLTIDAYGVAVRNGFEGTEEEWLASLKGEQGEKGADGADGADGMDSTLIVTTELVQDGMAYELKSTHSASEIYEHLQNGGMAVLDWMDGECLTLSSCTEESAVFSTVKVNGDNEKVATIVTIDNDKGWSQSGATLGGGNITVDDALDETSTNPVQNKVIANELRYLEEGIDNRLTALEQNGGGGGSGVVVSTPTYPFALGDADGHVVIFTDNNGKTHYVGQNDKPLKQNGNYDAEINMFICYGQSWSTGYDASAITTTQRYDNLMLDTGIMNNPLNDLSVTATSFVPAVEFSGKNSTTTPNQTTGETPVSAQMNIVKQLMEIEDGLTVNDLSYQLLGTAPGYGSKTLAQLEKGTDYYTRLISQVQRAHEIAAAMGKRLVVQAFSWVQGALGRTGNYAEALEQLRLDIDTDVKAITGQTQDVKCITWQSFIYNASLRAKQVYDQYVGAAETYPNIICAGATYHLDNVKATNLHFTSESQDWLGAYFGVAYKRTIIDGDGFEPLKPTKASKSGKILYVKFNVPQRPLVFDTERLTEAPNKGFKLYTTDGTEKTITEVAIISPDTVKIVCADDVASTDRLTYGEITTDTYQWVSDNHGNLRDSQGNHIQYESGAGNPLPLHNWCVIFDKTIAELEG